MKCKYKYKFPVDEFGRPGAMYSLADLPVVGYKVLERTGTLKKRDTEKELYEVEEKSILSLNNSKENLKKLQIQLDDLINEIEN